MGGRHKPAGRPVGAPRLDRACKRGHRRTVKSTYVDPRGKRVCRFCRLIVKQTYLRRKAERASTPAFAEPINQGDRT